MEYSAKNKVLTNTYFSRVYYGLLSSILTTLKFLVTTSVFSSILNRSYLLNNFIELISENVLKTSLLEKNYSLDSHLINRLNRLNSLNIDEI
jgi:hypothetical protein